MAETDQRDEALEATSVTNFNTTAAIATPAIITAMTITPPAGTYLAMFSGIGYNTNGNNSYEFSIFSAGAQVPHSARLVTPGGNQWANTAIPWETKAKVTVNGAQAVDVRVGSAGATQHVNARSLYLVRIDQ